jgi:hypothetical protein
MISQAIIEVYPTAIYSKERAGIWTAQDEFYNDIPLDMSVINAKVAELEIANGHKDDRRYTYPSIGDQLDMIFHAIEAGTLDTTSEFFTTLKAVKDANPKA